MRKEIWGQPSNAIVSLRSSHEGHRAPKAGRKLRPTEAWKGLPPANVCPGSRVWLKIPSLLPVEDNLQVCVTISRGGGGGPSPETVLLLVLPAPCV